MSNQVFTLDDLLASHARMVADKDKRITAALALSAACQVRNIEANSRHSLHVAELEARINDLGSANRSLLYDIGELRIKLEDKNRAPCGVVLRDSPTIVLKFTVAPEDWSGVNPDGSPRNPDGSQKIPTIKLMRKLAGLGLKEAKDLVEGRTELRTHAGWLNEAAIGGFTVQWWLNQLAEGKAKVFHGVLQVTIPAVQFTLTITEGKRDAQAHG